MELHETEAVPALREALGYVARHRGEVFVIKLESGLVEASVFPSLMRDIASLHRMGIRVVVVPGSRRQIDAMLRTWGVESPMSGEVRVTTEEAMPFVTLAAFDVCNRIMTHLAESGANALIGNWVKARGLGVLGGVDYILTGSVQSLRTEILRQLMGQEFVPIVPNIGWNSAGRPYNVSSTQLAMELAVQLGASKLFFLCDETPEVGPDLVLPQDVERSEGGMLSSLNLGQAEEFLSTNARKIGQPYRDYLHRALEACRKGVRRTHILDGQEDGALLREIFSQDGQGTMVFANEYDHIRRAEVRDVPDILRIQEPYVAQGVLLPRTAEQIEARIGDYVVHEADGFIQGSAALHPFPDGSAEVAAVAVAEHVRRFGVGRKIVQFLLQKAVRMGYDKVFLLTTQTSDWFAELGFERGDLSDLPADKASTYDLRRRSLVFVRTIRRSGT
ncbi:MAG TPA: amino-acid N-acetyltransferase [Fibrobacteria bacterium]|mgnify:FL=1|nr:amino-acid N-acetyltransferase [Fibrobacteria bacterium]HOX51906.1 amino-acid N-acetyltransferase [Fibrobacteria bacterium]